VLVVNINGQRRPHERWTLGAEVEPDESLLDPRAAGTAAQRGPGDSGITAVGTSWLEAA
jgi:hypothetical protein